MRKIHDRFLQEFPFMEQVESISPTMSYYKIGTYYHDRPTIGIDASLPEVLFCLRSMKSGSIPNRRQRTMTKKSMS